MRIRHFRPEKHRGLLSSPAGIPQRAQHRRRNPRSQSQLESHSAAELDPGRYTRALQLAGYNLQVLHALYPKHIVRYHDLQERTRSSRDHLSSFTLRKPIHHRRIKLAKMSYEMSTQQHGTRVGGRGKPTPCRILFLDAHEAKTVTAFNHNQSQAAEQEYDRLRNLARQEASKRANAFQRSQEAYQSGDGQAAHALSQEGKDHGAKMEQLNKQASEYIFRENNADGRVPADTIDLHGQFVEEAEDILEERINYARSHGQTHLHVIVGKGNHSVNHVQKIKPRVEQVCQQLGLQYRTEENEGRIYVKLDGSSVEQHDVNNWGGYQHYPDYQQGHAGGNQYQQPHQQQHQQQQYHQPQQQQYHQPHQQQQQQQHGQYDEAEKLAKKFLPRILKKLFRMFCK